MNPKALFQGLGILAILLINPLFSQMTTEVLTSYTNIKNPRIIDGVVIGTPDGPIAESPFGLVTVKTKSTKINFKASDVTRKKVTFVVVEDTTAEGIHTAVYRLVDATGDIWVEASCVDFDAKVFEQFEDTLTLGPPKPPAPPTPPTPPVPVPVKSFRVIFVKESGTTLNNEQTAVSSAKMIRDYLAMKTTPEGGLVGYREYDPQQTVNFEQPAMKTLWTSVKPTVTTVPCLVVEVNGKVSILPYPKNAAEALRTLKEIGG